jgi:hypothetical protein
MNEQIAVALISTLGAVAVAYIVNILAKRRKALAPKDRMENIFDGYEGLIKRQDEALNYKDDQLRDTRAMLRRMQKQIDDMNILVEKQRIELEKERRANIELHEQLNAMRKQYGIDKKLPDIGQNV